MAALVASADGGPFCAGVPDSVGFLSPVDADAVALTTSFWAAVPASPGFFSGAASGGLEMVRAFTAGTMAGTVALLASLEGAEGCLLLASDRDLTGGGFTSCAFDVRGRDAVPLALAADEAVMQQTVKLANRPTKCSVPVNCS